MGLAWWHRNVREGSSKRVFVDGLGCRDPVKTRLAEISTLVDSDDTIPAVNGELVIAGLADLAEELAAWANKVAAKDSGRSVFFAEVAAGGVGGGGHGLVGWNDAKMHPPLESRKLFPSNLSFPCGSRAASLRGRLRVVVRTLAAADRWRQGRAVQRGE